MTDTKQNIDRAVRELTEASNITDGLVGHPEPRPENVTLAEWGRISSAMFLGRCALKDALTDITRLEKALDDAGNIIAAGAIHNRVARAVPAGYENEGDWGPNDGGDVEPRMKKSLIARGRLWVQYLKNGAA